MTAPALLPACPIPVPAAELIELHLWLADRLARRFRNRGEALDDLVQVARLGLVEAATRFDPDRGSFAAFASSTISGVLKRHFRDHGWAVRPPRHIQELAVRMRQQWSTLSQQSHCVPGVQQLADALGETTGDVREALAANENYRLNHFDPLLEDAPGHTASGQAGFDQVDTRLEVEALLQQLGHDDRELLRLRFVEERSQSEIAVAIGTSQMQVSRLLRRLLDDLRSRLDPDAELAA